MATAAFDDVKPWPKAEPARVEIGSNSVPMNVMAVEEFTTALDKFPMEGGNTLRKRVAELVDSASRAKAEDDDSAGRCATLIKQMRTVETEIDRIHDAVKRPYLDSCSAITNHKKVVLGTLPTAMATVRGIADKYMRDKLAREQAEARRIEAQRAQERREAEAAAEAELAAARAEEREPDPEIIEAPITVATKAVEAAPTQVRSEFGGMASMAKKKVGIIVDWKKAFNAVKDDAGVKEAIQKAVDARIRAKITTIAGVEIKDDAQLRVR